MHPKPLISSLWRVGTYMSRGVQFVSNYRYCISPKYEYYLPCSKYMSKFRDNRAHARAAEHIAGEVSGCRSVGESISRLTAVEISRSDKHSSHAWQTLVIYLPGFTRGSLIHCRREKYKFQFVSRIFFSFFLSFSLLLIFSFHLSPSLPLLRKCHVTKIKLIERGAYPPTTQGNNYGL